MLVDERCPICGSRKRLEKVPRICAECTSDTSDPRILEWAHLNDQGKSLYTCDRCERRAALLKLVRWRGRGLLFCVNCEIKTRDHEQRKIR